MYVQWREREHEVANELVAADPNVMAVLTQCGLVKFFLFPFMRVQPRLLNYAVQPWTHLTSAIVMKDNINDTSITHFFKINVKK
jgi:hypothetical protein